MIKLEEWRDVQTDNEFVSKSEKIIRVLSLDENGYFNSDESCVTKTAGIFVAGDCRQKSIRQITTASADGAIAALAACRYIDNK